MLWCVVDIVVVAVGVCRRCCSLFGVVAVCSDVCLRVVLLLLVLFWVPLPLFVVCRCCRVLMLVVAAVNGCCRRCLPCVVGLVACCFLVMWLLEVVCCLFVLRFYGLR